MDRRALVVVGVAAAVAAAVLLVLGLDTGDPVSPLEPAPATVAPAGEAPEVSAARRAIPPIPVRDDDAPADEETALTDAERQEHKVTAEAVLEGAVRVCLSGWAADQGRADEPVTVRIQALTTEDGLADLAVKVPAEAPAEAEDCLLDTIHALPWPALPKVSDLEETWKYTTVPAAMTMDEAARHVAAVAEEAAGG